MATDYGQLASTSGNSYRQWLQNLANSGTFSGKEAQALLQVVGDDGKIDARFIQDPYSFKLADPNTGQVAGTGDGKTSYYGPQGINDINSIYYNEYNKALGNTGGFVGTTYSAADERAAYDDQIAAINRLLGYTQTQKDAGLSSLQAGMDDEARKLNDARTKAMSGYDEQGVQNNQAKLKGVNDVDDFANTSYKSLQRLLQGANAGNSSVGRELMPYLVSKSAGSRRQGVFDTAGQNEQSIVKARGDAEDEFNLSQQDLQNQRKSREQSLLETFLGKQNELETQRKDLEIKRAMANGQGYATARAAGDASQASIDSRMQQLASLFGQYKPNYTARAMNLKTPELSQFTVDKTAKINTGNNMPAESGYYLSQLQKKKQLEQGF